MKTLQVVMSKMLHPQLLYRGGGREKVLERGPPRNVVCC